MPGLEPGVSISGGTALGRCLEFNEQFRCRWRLAARQLFLVGSPDRGPVGQDLYRAQRLFAAVPHSGGKLAGPHRFGIPPD
jgi:hypothetical protein